jgi:hypothetical protein
VRALDAEDMRTPSAPVALMPRSDVAASTFDGRPAAEIAARVAELLVHGPSDILALEETLADLVRSARTDWPGIRGALAETTEKVTPGERSRDLPAATPLRQLHRLVNVLVWLPASDRPRGVSVTLAALMDRLDLPLDRPAGVDRLILRTPADILTLRLAEIAARIGAPSPVELVSTPTDPAGWIAPEVLVARISAAEDAGWQPWPVDFDQALLRLPLNPGPATIRAARQLASPDGRRLEGWLRGGRPTLPAVPNPLSSPVPLPVRPMPSTTGGLALARLATDPGGPAAPITLIHLLRRGWNAPVALADGSCWPICWPGLLPAHTDLVAAAASWHPQHPDAHGGCCEPHLLTQISRVYRYAGAISPGHGMSVALARGLVSRSPMERTDAAEALTLLAGSGQLDGAQFAAALTGCAVRPGRQFLRAATPILRQALEDQPRPGAAGRAAASIASTILNWLPAIAPPAVPHPVPYTAHLLDVATTALETVHRNGQKPPRVPAATAGLLTSLAGRSSRSPVSAAARRLCDSLR